jgi:hypothetical protein
MKMNVFRNSGGCKFRIFGISLVACLVLAFSGCKSPDSPSKPTVSSVTVSPASANVDKGGTRQFTAKVKGTNGPSQAVTWTVEGGGNGTTITGGLLTVALNESATSLTVRATSTANKSKSGTATVTVTSPPPTVTNVTVNPATARVDKGGSQQFTATVIGTNNPSQAVTWVVEGGRNGTTITEGFLTIAADETAPTLTLRATSTLDTGKSGTATVTVTEDTFPALNGVVIITGTPQDGYSLTANTNNLLGTGTINYQWKRASAAAAEGTNISGATAQTYDLVTADVGRYISVTVVRAGFTGIRTSEAVGPVEAAPTNTDPVQGTVTVNNGIENVTVSFTNTGVLTLPKNGSLTVTVSGSYQAYQWFVDGVALSGETGGSLILKGEDYTIGAHRILVIVYKNGVPYSQEIRFTVS